jgi:hypothetical protein
MKCGNSFVFPKYMTSEPEIIPFIPEKVKSEATLISAQTFQKKAAQSGGLVPGKCIAVASISEF